MEASREEITEHIERLLADAAKATVAQRETVARKIENMGNERMVVPGTKRYIPTADARELVIRLRAMNG